MSIIYRPCYVTREEVQSALDVKQSAANNIQIDRQIQQASDDTDDLCQRYFYPVDAQKFWMWPNFQYTYPWKVYFDQHGLIVLQSLESGGVAIPNNAVFLEPVNDGPPYTWMELNRSLNNSFGNGPTPQREIGITGTWGWWLNQFLATTLAAAITTTSQAQIQIAVSGAIGVGDTIFIDSERMIVVDYQYVATGQSQLGAGCSTASPADNQLHVTDVTQFAVGEILQLDSEWMKIISVNASTEMLGVKRAFSGSVLGTHSGAVIYAPRLLNVLRGQLGTAAATHLNNAPINVLTIPGLVKQVTLAKAVIGLTQESGSYAGSSGQIGWRAAQGARTEGEQTEPYPGTGLIMLEERMMQKFGRRARSRVV